MTTKICWRFHIICGYTCVCTFHTIYTYDIIYIEVLLRILAALRIRFRFPYCAFVQFDRIYHTNLPNCQQKCVGVILVLVPRLYLVDLRATRRFRYFHVTICIVYKTSSLSRYIYSLDLTLWLKKFPFHWNRCSLESLGARQWFTW